MRVQTLVNRNLAGHWRHNLPVCLGVVVATATLTGALLVGDSMRASLGEAALERLGDVDYALTGGRFVRETFASDLRRAGVSAGLAVEACPLIVERGAASHADTGIRVHRINIFGVDQSFWEMSASATDPHVVMPTGRSVVLNAPLARELGATAGDEVLLRLGQAGSISTETLFGRRDDTTVTLRLTVDAVVEAKGLASFSLRQRQLLPRNAWVPLGTLQRALKQPERVNTILVADQTPDGTTSRVNAAALQQLCRRFLTLEDLGLHLRIDKARGYVALESEAILLEPAVETAGLAAAGAAKAMASPVLSYLANTIAVEVPAGATSPEGREQGSGAVPAPPPGVFVPYSTVAAFQDGPGGVAPLSLVDGSPAPALQQGEILINEWTAGDLNAQPGDHITLTYYLTGPYGQLETRQATFVLRGVVRMDEFAVDPGFVPSYEGITDTDNIGDWDPPFPIDLNLIRDQDEAYWDRYRTSPKAFVSLEEARRLWAGEAERFGQATSLRIAATASTDLEAMTKVFEGQLLEHVDIAALGLRFDPVRERASAASSGSTDFGMLFVSFSFFLIASACMLIALLFRLGVERRAGEIGILLATGFTPAKTAGLLAAEGALIAGIGAVPGLLAALGYAWLMLAGLRTWWSDAVSAPFLRLHAPPATLVIGYIAGVLIALVSILWSVRGLTRLPPRTLLGGAVAIAGHADSRQRQKLNLFIVGATLALAGLLIALAFAGEVIPRTVAFFGSGASLLVTCLAASRIWLDLGTRGFADVAGWRALVRLGLGNAPRHPGRSLLTIGLIASATFIIVALEAFRLDVSGDVRDKGSGSGGFALVGESVVPLPYDLNTTEGREALAFAETSGNALTGTTFVPFRLRPGDESSCLNLYMPTEPRILGATEAMIQRGGFSFSSSLAASEEERQNPWRLLTHAFTDGAVPVIGDEAAVMWQLHLGLGKDLVITDQRGGKVTLRFVGLLAGSALQDELIIAESQFLKLFPSINGHSFFLIDLPDLSRLETVQHTLERELSGFAFDAAPITQRLAEYLAVQNTYLSTFQALGGLGLVFGTIGLSVVLLRNVWERRAELALMRALGFSRTALSCIVLSENVALVLVGLAAGTLPAILAVAPHIYTRSSQLPWMSLAATLTAVFVVSVATGAVALRPTLRAPLIPALRTE